MYHNLYMCPLLVIVVYYQLPSYLAHMLRTKEFPMVGYLEMFGDTSLFWIHKAIIYGLIN